MGGLAQEHHAVFNTAPHFGARGNVRDMRPRPPAKRVEIPHQGLPARIVVEPRAEPGHHLERRRLGRNDVAVQNLGLAGLACRVESFPVDQLQAEIFQ